MPVAVSEKDTSVSEDVKEFRLRNITLSHSSYENLLSLQSQIHVSAQVLGCAKPGRTRFSLDISIHIKFAAGTRVAAISSRRPSPITNYMYTSKAGRDVSNAIRIVPR
jgi:hypothetical protein